MVEEAQIYRDIMRFKPDGPHAQRMGRQGRSQPHGLGGHAAARQSLPPHPPEAAGCDWLVASGVRSPSAGRRTLRAEQRLVRTSEPGGLPCVACAAADFTAGWNTSCRRADQPGSGIALIEVRSSEIIGPIASAGCPRHAILSPSRSQWLRRPCGHDFGRAENCRLAPLTGRDRRRRLGVAFRFGRERRATARP